MASKKNIEMRALSTEELEQELAASVSQYHKLTITHSVTDVENTNTIKESRRDIARIKTELRSRELAACSPEELAKRSKIRARRRKKF